MAQPTQVGRKFRVATTLGEDVLLLERFAGEEAVSRPFLFTLEMVSERPEIDPEALMRQPATLAMALPGGGERVVHGHVRRFVQLDSGVRFTAYQAELVPWLWFLSLGSDCRIFQGQSVPEIVTALFGELGYRDFELRLIGSYAPREYCVQYRETHLAFVSRLLEEEGIFYFFRHEADRHVLVLADSPSAVKPCPGQETARVVAPGHRWQDENVVTSLALESAVHTGRVTLSDYNYLQPSASMRAPIGGDGPDERYDYPGRYDRLADGERLARLQLEAREAERRVLRGTGTCRAFQPGYAVTLEDDLRRSLSRSCQLLRVRHMGDGGSFSTDGAEQDAVYECSFDAIPQDVPYRPPCTTPRPLVHGSQTAVVVGKSGEEIWTDAHGRVKVQFHWDRRGRRDEHSSCWVRVSTQWAGKGWGSLAIPRIGQEVIVDFLEGDPDRPIITGKVYNAEQPPPYDPGAGGVVSGLRSKTHRGSGYNEMSMDDTTGRELITIHGQYDMDTTVEHDERVTIGNDRTERVGKDETITIAANRTERVGANESGTILANRTWSIGAAESLTVGGARAVTVALAAAETVGLAKALTIGGAYQITVGGLMNTSVAGAMMEQVGISRSIDVARKFTLEAGEEIVLKTGAASIRLLKSGDIVIKGKKIVVDGSGNVVVKAPKIAKN